MSWIRETDVAVPSVISCMSINPDLMAAVQNLNCQGHLRLVRPYPHPGGGHRHGRIPGQPLSLLSRRPRRVPPSA